MTVFDELLSLFPFLGEVVSYVIGLAKMQTSVLRDLLSGSSISFYVTNIFTGSLSRLYYVGYREMFDTLFSILGNNVIGDFLRNILLGLVSALGNVIGTFFIGSLALDMPLYVGLPFVVIRLRIMFMAFRLVKNNVSSIL